MKFKLILPSLVEAESSIWRPIKYSLFPPLGLATLAAYIPEEDEIEIVDQHVENLNLEDNPDIVIIQVYITNAFRSYKIADHYRSKGIKVLLGGLHVTSLPNEALQHADAIFIGPGEATFPEFLEDLKNNRIKKKYFSDKRTLENLPPVRRDLIKRHLYLVPNSIVVSRGCPFHCNFCYKDAFFKGGKGFYTQKVDHALAEIERLPGKHLYFLDDHLLGNRKFANQLFSGMQGMHRVFQGAATVDSILNGNLIEKAAETGLRSVFVGFESVNQNNLISTNKRQNINSKYELVTRRLNDLGIMINGSFVFGLDGDTTSVFHRTVDWAVKQGITTSTFHIATPYPGTSFYQDMASQGRLISKNWDQFDTRQVVFNPSKMTARELKMGYDWAYKEFYRWSNITKASLTHEDFRHKLKHFVYSSGWKKFEPLWNAIITAKNLTYMTPFLEAILSRVSRDTGSSKAASCLTDV